MELIFLLPPLINDQIWLKRFAKEESSIFIFRLSMSIKKIDGLAVSTDFRSSAFARRLSLYQTSEVDAEAWGVQGVSKQPQATHLAGSHP